MSAFLIFCCALVLSLLLRGIAYSVFGIMPLEIEGVRIDIVGNISFVLIGGILLKVLAADFDPIELGSAFTRFLFAYLGLVMMAVMSLAILPIFGASLAGIYGIVGIQPASGPDGDLGWVLMLWAPTVIVPGFLAILLGLAIGARKRRDPEPGADSPL